MKTNVVPWYARNYPAWLALVLIVMGALLYYTRYSLFLFLSSWLFSYSGALSAIFLLGGAFGTLGAWIARKRKTLFTYRIALFSLLFSLGMLAEVNTGEKRGYTQEDVSFMNEGVDLEGTIYLPARDIEGGIVLVHGSADFDRGFYHVWADYFARNGIAVLSFDKRGTGDSGGVFVENNNAAAGNLNLLASDVIAGLERLLEEKELQGVPVGIWGISQAGWILPLVADQYPVDFLLFVSGPTCTVREEQVYSEIRGDHTREATGSREEAEEAVLQNGPGGFDPVPYLENITIPAFWVYGNEDDSIPVGRSTAILDTLIARGKPFEYDVLPQTDHILFARTGLPRFNPAYWRITTEWMRQNILLSPAQTPERSVVRTGPVRGGGMQNDAVVLEEMGLLVSDRNGHVRVTGRIDNLYPEVLLEAGIRPPARVLEFNGEEVQTSEELSAMFKGISKGNAFVIKFEHQGKINEFELEK